MGTSKKRLSNSSAKSLKNSLQKKVQEKATLLTFDNLVKEFHSLIRTFPDFRSEQNSRKSLNDAVMGAFSMFFTQNPSFLAYQAQMQQIQGRNNAEILFGVKDFLSDNHIRQLIDPISASHLDPMFEYVFKGLKQEGYLDSYRSSNNSLLVALDGVRYFSSKKIRCDNCSTTHHPDGGVTYHHDVLMATLVKPACCRVIPLSPEFIVPQDGHQKQDCELSAGKRWLKRNKHIARAESITILGDDLYSRQPFCRQLLSHGYHFILVCKPESHKTLYEYVECLGDDLDEAIWEEWKGPKKVISRYRFANELPIKDGKDALKVNWCEIVETVEGKGITYKNSFITDHQLTPKNVAAIVEDGRTRWKIENENNNVLKNRGYNLKHNFGHGKKNLATFFVSLILLAFLAHTTLELFDEKYNHLRGCAPSRKTFFGDIRTLTKFLCFYNWEKMMDFMIRGLKEAIPLEEIKHYARYDTS